MRRMFINSHRIHGAQKLKLTLSRVPANQERLCSFISWWWSHPG